MARWDALANWWRHARFDLPLLMLHMRAITPAMRAGFFVQEHVCVYVRVDGCVRACVRACVRVCDGM